MEIVPDLAARARTTLAQAGYRNVEVRSGNGYRGWPERAPFDRIIVTAAPRRFRRRWSISSRSAASWSCRSARRIRRWRSSRRRRGASRRSERSPCGSCRWSAGLSSSAHRTTLLRYGLSRGKQPDQLTPGEIQRLFIGGRHGQGEGGDAALRRRRTRTVGGLYFTSPRYEAAAARRTRPIGSYSRRNAAEGCPEETCNNYRHRCWNLVWREGSAEPILPPATVQTRHNWFELRDAIAGRTVSALCTPGPSPQHSIAVTQKST